MGKQRKAPARPPARTSAGYFLSIDYASVTRNGKTVVTKDVRVERRLVDGVWVDVKPKGPTK